MATPTRFPDWATESEVSPEGAPNKVEVPEEFKLSGLKSYEPLPRAYFNDQLNLIGLWVRELKTQFDALVVDSSTAILQQIFPVGSYWMTDSTVNPADQLGFGTWEKVKGKFLVGQDSADTAFDGIGETGGSKTHNHGVSSLTVEGHTLTINEIPSHNHQVSFRSGESDSGTSGSDLQASQSPSEFTATTTSTGGNAAHSHELSGNLTSANNLPPYKVTNIWVRKG